MTELLMFPWRINNNSWNFLNGKKTKGLIKLTSNLDVVSFKRDDDDDDDNDLICLKWRNVIVIIICNSIVSCVRIKYKSTYHLFKTFFLSFILTNHNHSIDTAMKDFSNLK